MSRDRPAPATEGQQRSELESVERVPGAEHEGGEGARQWSTTGGDDADEGELRGAGEHHQRQRTRLRHRQPRRDRDGAERDAVEPGGDADAEAVTDDGASQGEGVGHSPTLTSGRDSVRDSVSGGG